MRLLNDLSSDLMRSDAICTQNTARPRPARPLPLPQPLPSPRRTAAEAEAEADQTAREQQRMFSEAIISSAGRPPGPPHLRSAQIRSPVNARRSIDRRADSAVPQRSAAVPTSYTYINSRVLCTSTTRVSGACDSMHCTQWFFLRPERPIGSGMQVCVCECCVCTVLCIMRWQQQSARKESRVESSRVFWCGAVCARHGCVSGAIC